MFHLIHQFKELSKNNGPASMTTTEALPMSLTASKDVPVKDCEDFAKNCVERAEFCSNAAFTQFMTHFCAKTCNRCNTFI
uniref:ShKT domain-containing protein n=1 Tax=Ascaris lumbricoides TaxID=6252 RepID=A0A0M3IK53_ASCLU